MSAIAVTVAFFAIVAILHLHDQVAILRDRVNDLERGTTDKKEPTNV